MTTAPTRLELAAVGEHHDLAARAPDHGELEAGGGDARRGQAGPHVDAVGAQEGLVGIELLDHVERPGTLDRVELGAVEAAQKDELDAQPRAAATAARLGVTMRASRLGSMWRTR